MRKEILRLLISFICLSTYLSVFSQDYQQTKRDAGTITDSLRNSGVIFDVARAKHAISLSKDEAVRFLEERYQQQNWKDLNDPLRQAIGQLIFEASHPRFDSSEYFLRSYPYDSLSIPWDKFYIWEPLNFKIPVIAPVKFSLPVDTAGISDTTAVAGINDSIGISQLTIADPFAAPKPITSLKDTTILVVIDTLHEVKSSYQGFPFRFLSFPYQTDSIQIAVRSLLNYLEERDSTVINFTGVDNSITPVWMNSKSSNAMRFWLKNEYSDSVTVWIGNPSRNTFGLFLEQGINFRRPVRQNNYSDAKVNIKTLDNTKLLDVQKIVIKPQFWKYRTEASFILNQSSLTNWVKGGENSISTALDITGYADYNNKNAKVSSSNFARLKFGYIASGDKGIRKNLDLLETNSKLNHKAFGKFDFSGIMLFKTQIAKGYNYPNDSVPVSKFMNPATLTIGFGLDYKPNKNTSINFSPLSYKGTFVTDTAHIDQTKYGILKDRKSLHEPGVSFMISNEWKPTKTITVTNRLQLFTNYVHNPQNIDIDWEMIAVAKLNWFTDVRFNTHFIFDDDTKTVELDKDKNPVLRADGTQKKTARIQFKEMLGFSVVFRF